MEHCDAEIRQGVQPIQHHPLDERKAAMLFYITAHAFTHGIIELFGEYDQVTTGLVKVTHYSRNNLSIIRPYYNIGDWHETKEEAIAQAKKMKTDRLDQLARQYQSLLNTKINEKMIRHYP